MIGTLMWVGDTTAAEFRSAVQYCLLNVSQLAFRRDHREALARPASDVRWIVFAQSNRNWFDAEPLINQYPTAKCMTLLGPLCQGFGFSRNRDACDWQRWHDVMPEWLDVERPTTARCRNVAVVAANLTAAEPLLELADSVGASAVWCRHPSRQSVRNFDAVWWDDSAAAPASQSGWHDRIEAFARPDRRVRHAWIANSPCLQDARDAQAAGIELLVSKPHRIDPLLGMLDQSASVGRTNRLRAA